MRDTVLLRVQIEKARRRTERGYTETLKRVERLKNEMSQIEQSISQNGQTPTGQDLEQLKLAIRSLDRTVDSQILMTRKAWEKHAKLEQHCKKLGIQSNQLKELRVLCNKMEHLAADLLCYSLGRFEPTE